MFYWTDANFSAMFFNSERFSRESFLSRNKHRMATRVIKLREAEEPAPETVQELLSQSKRPEVGRFRSKWIGKQSGHTLRLKLPKRLEWSLRKATQ